MFPDDKRRMEKEHVYKLYFYVLGGASLEETPVVKNVRNCLREALGTSVTLDVIEVVSRPEAAVKEGILFTPTLLRISTQPNKRVVGNFLDKEKTMAALKLIQTLY